MATRQRMYRELATWWPVLSPPSHYVEESASLLKLLFGAAESPPETLLELGSGGGSIAWHFKQHMQLTLSDLSPEMIEISRAVNPECDHFVSDMRSLRLGRTFDAVFLHDAVMYMTDETSVRAALETAALHCRPGGVFLLVPDHVRESFEPFTDHGGDETDDGRALRYLEWVWDPHPDDNVATVVFSFLLRDPDGTVHNDMDVQQFGLFPRDSWLAWLREAGFDPSIHEDEWDREVFVCKRM